MKHTMTERRLIPQLSGSLPLSEWKQLPIIEAVYIFYDEDAVYYVGRSYCIRSRVQQHRGRSKFCTDEFVNRATVGWLVVDEPIHNIALRERELIFQLQPLFNCAKDKKFKPWNTL